MRIYIILGPSASGKDTVYQKLLQQCPQLRPIVYYTTRPRGANELNGRDYFFVTEKTIDKLEEQGKVIEKRVYDTIKGKWTYATVNDGQFDRDGDYIIVLPPKAYYSFVEYFGKSTIVPIFIHVPDGIRLRRSLERDEKQEKRYLTVGSIRAVMRNGRVRGKRERKIQMHGICNQRRVILAFH